MKHDQNECLHDLKGKKIDERQEKNNDKNSKMKWRKQRTAQTNV